MAECIASLLSKLAIPPDYARIEHLTDKDALQSRSNWKNSCVDVLSDLLELLKGCEDLTLPEKADVVFAASPFTEESGVTSLNDNALTWISPEADKVASDIMSLPMFRQPTKELIEVVLSEHVKPIFKASPHPRLHSATGRSLPSPAGGASGIQDYYEGQTWKRYPGIASPVFWCVKYVNADDYENMWHLVIPPTMTLLDDYEVKNKLRGVRIVREMLGHVPGDLLKRTGLDKLINSSLRNCLSHLDSPDSFALVRDAISTSVSLIHLSTTTGRPGAQSSERFDALSELLGEGIISGIWMYADEKPMIIQATFESLPSVISALQIGTVRFLQALIPQLAHSLIPRPLVSPRRELQLSALRVFAIVLETCGPRIDGWKDTILDAVGRCWVGIADAEVHGEKDNEAVKTALRGICNDLAQVCPPVLNDFEQLLGVDERLFKELFTDVSSA